MDGSPFNRSGLTRRSPPPTPAPKSTPPPPAPPQEEDDAPEVASTSELQTWMKTIEHCLNEVCVIASEGKLNSDQKLRINNYCRKVGHGTSQMAIQYQALKQKAIQSHYNLQALKEKLDLSQQLSDLKKSIEETTKPVLGSISFADMLKKGTNNFDHPNQISSIAIYPTDKLKSSEETKSLVQKIIRPQEMKLHVRGLRKVKNGGVIISTDSKDDIQKLKHSELATSGFTVDDTPRRKPRIIIIGVPTDMQDSDVFNCIYNQNLADRVKDMTLQNFLSNIKLSHKSGKRDSAIWGPFHEATSYNSL